VERGQAPGAHGPLPRHNINTQSFLYI
jgi:hypothetical protein